MSNKSTASNKPVSATTNSNSSAFSRRTSMAASRHLTSEAIATDIAMFKRGGGRIEVLGNTARRSQLPPTTFRSNVKPDGKVAAASAENGAKTAP